MLIPAKKSQDKSESAQIMPDSARTSVCLSLITLRDRVQTVIPNWLLRHWTEIHKIFNFCKSHWQKLSRNNQAESWISLDKMAYFSFSSMPTFFTTLFWSPSSDSFTDTPLSLSWNFKEMKVSKMEFTGEGRWYAKLQIILCKNNLI